MISLGELHSGGNEMQSFLALLLVFISLSASAAVGSLYGSFVGKVKSEWLESDGDGAARKMRLLADFSYKDPAGKVWTAPEGWVIDGASIPWVFWSVVGSPFVGDYRSASVVHDYYCDTQTEPWREVHEMFYWAALAAGVGETKAKILYAAVYAGGPRWGEAAWPSDPNGQYYAFHGAHLFERPKARWTPKSLTKPSAEIGEAEAREIAHWISRSNPDLPAIAKEVAKYVDDAPPAFVPFSPGWPLKDPSGLWRGRNVYDAIQ